MPQPLKYFVVAKLSIFFRHAEHFLSLFEHKSHNTDNVFNTLFWHLIHFLLITL